MNILIYLMAASVFLAAQVFTIDIKIMQLSIFRITLILISVYFFLLCLKNDKKISLSIRNDNSLFINFYFLWFLYSFISIGWVQDYSSWLKAVFFIGSGLLCIVILSQHVKSERQFSNIFNIMLIMIVFHNIIGWYELKTGNYRFVDMSKFDPYHQMSWNIAARTPISMLGNSNDYATMMVFGVFIAYICLSISKPMLWKLFSAVSMVSCAAICIRSYSRANIIGLFIGITVLLYSRFSKKKFSMIIVVLLAIPIMLLAVPTYFSDTLDTLSNILEFNFIDAGGSESIRLNLIKNGFLFLRDTFGFGTGAGNIEYWMATKNVYYVGGVRNIHNWWMEILVGYGIVIFGLYILMYVKMATGFYFTILKTKDKYIKNVSLGLLCCMSSFTIGSISSSSNISKEWLWFFWGVAIAFSVYITHKSEITR